MTFVSVEVGGRRLVVWAERARIDVDAGVALLDEVTLRLAGDAELPALDLRCASARLSLERDHFRLEGNVRGRTAEGRRFRAEWLEFGREAGVLETTAPVSVTEGASSVTGGALRYDLATRRLEVLDGARLERLP